MDIVLRCRRGSRAPPAASTACPSASPSPPPAAARALRAPPAARYVFHHVSKPWRLLRRTSAEAPKRLLTRACVRQQGYSTPAERHLLHGDRQSFVHNPSLCEVAGLADCDCPPRNSFFIIIINNVFIDHPQTSSSRVLLQASIGVDYGKASNTRPLVLLWKGPSVAAGHHGDVWLLPECATAAPARTGLRIRRKPSSNQLGSCYSTSSCRRRAPSTSGCCWNMRTAATISSSVVAGGPGNHHL